MLGFLASVQPSFENVSIGKDERTLTIHFPSFIHISDGKLHDVNALDLLMPETGAIYLMDRGYIDFARLYVLHASGAFFVTIVKANLDAHRLYSSSIDRDSGIICDQTLLWMASIV